MFPILSLYIYVKLRDAEMSLVGKTILICIVPIIAYHLKVLNVIILLAVILTEMICLHSSNKRDFAKLGVGILIALACSYGFQTSIEKLVDYQPDEDKQLSVEWFLLLGSNDASYGQWNYHDYDLAIVQPQTREERQELVYQEIQDRIKNYGAKRWIGHWKNKAHIFYDDASFGWCIARGIVNEMPEETSSVTGFIRQIFFPPENYSMYCDVEGYGKYFMYYSGLCQCVWLMVLCGIFGFIWKPIKQKDRIDMVLEITWIGVFLFSMLFEASARLLLSYIPVFVLMVANVYKSKRDSML